jgi:hypothetical protein
LVGAICLIEVGLRHRNLYSPQAQGEPGALSHFDNEK